jgi:hypothetical protein
LGAERSGLEGLQDYAKEWAEHQQVTVVFVVSETPTLELMRQQQSWSRAFEPFDIPYVSDDESCTFLHGRGVTGEAADQVVEVGAPFFRTFPLMGKQYRRSVGHWCSERRPVVGK